MIVADASLIANLLVQPPAAGLAREVLLRDREWWAPTFWRFELHSALLKYVRARTISIPICDELMQRGALLMGQHQRNAASADVLRIASGFGISSYDAEYVALAQRLGVSLVTFDQKLVRAVPGIAISPAKFVQ